MAVRALVLDRSGGLSLQARPVPRVDGECLIRVTAAGICGTDLELLRGYAGFSGVPGHEFVGVVEEAGPADVAWVGQRVVGEITVGCGTCAGCRAAGRGHCDRRSVLGIRGRDGAFAEYLSLPAANLHPVPASLDDMTAVFVEPAAAACRVAEQVTIEPGMRAAVVGAGRLGLLVAQVLRMQGAGTVAIVRSSSSTALAAGFGLEAVDTRSAGGLARRFDVVVDATGEASGFETACSLVRPRGTLVVKSTIHGETPVALSSLVVDEITVIGSRCGPFPAAIAALDDGRISVASFVREVYSLERFDEAFSRARAGGKAIFTPSAA